MLIPYNSERIYWAVEQVEQEAGDIDTLHLDDNLFYIKSEADEVISTIRAERDEYRYNLSCARNEINNIQISMREDVKTIAEKDAEITKLKTKATTLLGCLKYLVMRDLIKDCPSKKTATEIVEEYDNGLR